MKNLFAVLLLILPQLVFAAGGGKGHDIQITVKGLKQDSTARIGYYFGKDRFVAQDTAKADKNGTLVFKGKKVLPAGVYICLLPKGYFEFLVTEQSFSLSTDTPNFELNMKVKGSKENAYFYEFRKFTTHEGHKADSISKILSKRKNADSIKMLKGKLHVIDSEVEVFRKDFIAKYPGTYAVKLLQALPDPEIPVTPLLPNGRKDSTFPYRYYKAHYFDNIDFSDDRIIRTPFYAPKLERYLKTLVVPDVDSIIYDADRIIERSRANDEVFKFTLSWILNYYDESKYMGMDAVSSHIIEKYYLTGQAKWASDIDIASMRKRDSIVNRLLIGKKAPDLYLYDSSGKLINLYSVEKQYIILYFWDATCGHCQHATPILHDFYEKYKDTFDFEIYAPTIQRKPDDIKGWEKYINDHHLGDWINVWDSHTYYNFDKTYDINSTPVIYILDADKKIIAKRLDVDQLLDLFNKLEKKQIKKP